MRGVVDGNEDFMVQGEFFMAAEKVTARERELSAKLKRGLWEKCWSASCENSTRRKILQHASRGKKDFCILKKLQEVNGSCILRKLHEKEETVYDFQRFQEEKSCSST